MNKKSTISIAFALLCSMILVSCSLMLSSEERKLVGKWHEKIQETEGSVIVHIEDWDEYTEDKKVSSYGKVTFQCNIGEDGYNFIVYASADFTSSGIWDIVDGDKLISKDNQVNFSSVTITSSEDLDANAVQDLKKEIEQSLQSDLRDEMLKKDTTEIVLLNDSEFKYKGTDGTVYTMTKVN